MNRAIRWLPLSALLLLSGCGPKEPPPPPEPTEAERAAVQHEGFFGDAAKDPAIVWRSSGLGIKIVAPGEGAAPGPSDRVRVHYIGRLKDGKVFDDSHLRGKPSDFVVNRLITGWAAAMPALKPGGKAVFFIPPSLGYGGMKSGDIPAVSGLIFEVELLAVNPELPAKPAEKTP
jgi:FKBP-type peptidyl-prolyl cis-trans isomerase FklB